MPFRRLSMFVFATLGCVPSAPILPTPDGAAPSVHVSTREVLIVFPADSGNDLPWPAQRLSEVFAGPFWEFIAASPGGTPSAAAAHFGAVDSLRLDSFSSLADVIRRAIVRKGDLSEHVIVCFDRISGDISLVNEQVVLRITDRSWVAALRRNIPDSASLRVMRPGRRLWWSGRVPIVHVRAGTASGDSRARAAQLPPN